MKVRFRVLMPFHFGRLMAGDQRRAASFVGRSHMQLQMRTHRRQSLLGPRPRLGLIAILLLAGGTGLRGAGQTTAVDRGIQPAPAAAAGVDVKLPSASEGMPMVPEPKQVGGEPSSVVFCAFRVASWACIVA